MLMLKNKQRNVIGYLYATKTVKQFVRGKLDCCVCVVQVLGRLSFFALVQGISPTPGHNFSSYFSPLHIHPTPFLHSTPPHSYTNPNPNSPFIMTITNKSVQVGVGVLIMHAQKVLLGKRIGSHGASKFAFANAFALTFNPFFLFSQCLTFYDHREGGRAVLADHGIIILLFFLLYRHLAIGRR